MDDQHSDAIVLPQRARLVRPWRCFGAVGAFYEIIGTGSARPGWDRVMSVRVVGSGEALDDRLGEVLADLRER